MKEAWGLYYRDYHGRNLVS